MKRKRCAAAGIMLAMLLTMLCGCAANKTLEEQMVSHMEEKYGDVFTYMQPWGSSLGKKSVCRVLQSDRYPGQDVLVSCSREDGELVFLDSYPALQLQPLAADEFQQACNDTWPGIQVRTEQIPALRVIPEGMCDNLTLEAYTSWQYNGDYYNIFVDIRTDKGSGEADIERLRQAMEAHNIAARMYLYYGTDTDNYSCMACLQMDGEYKYIRKEWEDPAPEEARKTGQEERKLFWKME